MLVIPEAPQCSLIFNWGFLDADASHLDAPEHLIEGSWLLFRNLS